MLGLTIFICCEYKRYVSNRNKSSLVIHDRGKNARVVYKKSFVRLLRASDFLASIVYNLCVYD